MTDISKALEAAVDAYGDPLPTNSERRAAIRAAVLAFLKAMPDEVTVYIPHDPQYASQLSYVVPNVASRLTDAIEKEAP